MMPVIIIRVGPHCDSDSEDQPESPSHVPVMIIISDGRGRGIRRSRPLAGHSGWANFNCQSVSHTELLVLCPTV